MSIIICRKCDKKVDIDKEEAYALDDGRGYWLCEYCFEYHTFQIEYNQTNSDTKD